MKVLGTTCDRYAEIARPPVLPLLAALLVAVQGVLAAEVASETLTIVESGRPRAVLVLSEDAIRVAASPERGKKNRSQPTAASEERLAAEELREHVQKISGAELEIVDPKAAVGDRLPIYIGSAADSALDQQLLQRGNDPGAFALMIGPESVAIRGLSADGTLNGCYEFLEQIGVRWFMPGELGTVIPATASIRVRQQATFQVPSFPARQLQGVGSPRWERRMRLGGPYFPASHGCPGFGGKESQRLFQEHPEYFSLIEGERKPRQLCVSSPGVLAVVVDATKEYFRSHPETRMMGIGANDGRGFCECENCCNLDGGDYDPFGHHPSMTDRYVWFFNRVLEGIEEEFPDRRLGFYAYSVYNRPPVKVTPDRRLVPAVALITLCRLHGMANPVCPEKSYEQQIIRQWGRLVPEVYYRGYWFNLADPGLPFFMMPRLRYEIPLGKELGIAGWRVESPYEWAASVPSRYIASKLMWDHTADVDALLSDFYEKFFGPAARPMQEYLEIMSEALAGADYHTGSSWDMPHVYGTSVRTRAHAALDRAADLAPDGAYARRVAMFLQSLDHLDAFVEMLASRAEHDYVSSKKALDRMETIREDLLASEPPLIGRHAEDYLNRFFAQATLEGFERTSGGNRLVAPLGDLWQFQIDPEEIGEAVGWWRPENTGGNWLSIKTSTLSWSSQGLRYYKGLAWYRQAVEIPAEWQGKRVFLWFGGIDELAKVWINGRSVGISPKASFIPFEMDATEAIRPGRTNTVVVCVSNMVLNELGTGGITGPVMLYAPAAGSEAELRNAKPPHETFPEY